MGWFKNLFKNNHVCKFKEDIMDYQITATQTIHFYNCRCGKQKIRRVFFQGENEGKVVWEDVN
jgi:hypothetical protein